MKCPSCGSLVGVQDERCLNCGRRNPGLWGYGPILAELGRDFGVSQLIVGLAVIIYLGMLLFDMSGVSTRFGMDFLAPSGRAAEAFGASGAVPVIRDGHWWTLLSAGWLHGSALHIAMNLWVVTSLIQLAAHVFGPARTLIIYLASSVVGFLFSSFAILAPGPIRSIMGHGYWTLGASAALFGLIGALIFFGRATGNTEMNQRLWSWVILMAVIGIAVPGIDNWAHLGGFAGGYGLAAMLDPRQPEQGNHLVWALVLLVASLGSVAFSVLVAVL